MRYANAKCFRDHTNVPCYLAYIVSWYIIATPTCSYKSLTQALCTVSGGRHLADKIHGAQPVQRCGAGEMNSCDSRSQLASSRHPHPHCDR